MLFFLYFKQRICLIKIYNGREFTTRHSKIKRKINKERIIDLFLLEMDKVIIGQKMSERLLIALLSNGHVLLEGLPGLAKTLAISTLSNTISAQFSRLQFTPDLLPADIIGTQNIVQK